ncbi:MAG: hypothetical protein ACYC9J_11820 [Sulfuricaulis sp.]
MSLVSPVGISLTMIYGPADWKCPLEDTVRCHINYLAKLFFGVSVGALLGLVCLRYAQPQIVVGTSTGFWINVIWGFSFSSGVAEWNGLLNRLGLFRYWYTKAIIGITTLYICGITDTALGIQCFSFSGLNPIAIVFFTIVAIVLVISWWKIIIKGAVADSRELRARPVLMWAFIVVCVLIVILGKAHQ